MGFKMKGFTYPGKSPAKAKPKISLDDELPESKKKVSEYATKSLKKPKKDLSEISNKLDNVKKTQDFLHKEHDIYKGKKLRLSGQVSKPDINVDWDKGPTVDAKTKASLRGDYKLGKKTTLSAGANVQNYAWDKGSFDSKTLKANPGDPTSQPFWAGVKINL